MDVKFGSGAFMAEPAQARATGREHRHRRHRRRPADDRAAHRHEPGAGPHRRQCARGARSDRLADRARRATAGSTRSRWRSAPSCCCSAVWPRDRDEARRNARRRPATAARRRNAFSAWWRRWAVRPISWSGRRSICRARPSSGRSTPHRRGFIARHRCARRRPRHPGARRRPAPRRGPHRLRRRPRRHARASATRSGPAGRSPSSTRATAPRPSRRRRRSGRPSSIADAPVAAGPLIRDRIAGRDVTRRFLVGAACGRPPDPAARCLPTPTR